MVTTIQVTEEVLEYLKNYRDKTRAESYNEVIKKMIQTITKQGSLYGFLKQQTKEENE